MQVVGLDPAQRGVPGAGKSADQHQPAMEDVQVSLLPERNRVAHHLTA
jgi:hypothetical protein